MAVITPTIENIDKDKLYGGWVRVTWTPLANGDTGAPVDLVPFADRSVQVAGTFGAGGNLRFQGTNDGTNYATLNDPQGNALDVTAAKIEAIQELTYQVRPNVTAGDGTTSLTVTMLCKGRL